MTDDEYLQASKDLASSVKDMHDFFAREGYSRLSGAIADALTYSSTSGEVYDNFQGCFHEALRDYPLDASRRAQIGEILKLIDLVIKEARQIK